MMFRDKSISKLYAYALAAVFALTLAGCGGGGGGAAAPAPGPTPAAQMASAAAAAAMAARDANTAATAARAAANAAPGSMAAADAAMAAEMAAGEAQTAAEAAAMANNLADAEMYRDAAQTKAGEAQTQLAAAQTASSNAIADARILESRRDDALAGPISSAETATSAAQTAANSAKRDADAQYAKAVAARTHANDTDEDDEGSVMDAVAAAQAAVSAANTAARQVSVAKATIMNADNTQTIAAEVEKARAAMTNAATAMTNAAAALKDAMAAAGEHVLALFRAANALDVIDKSMSTDENETAMARLTAIVGLFTNKDGKMHTPTFTKADGNKPAVTNLISGGTAVSKVTVTYGLDTKDDEDTADMDESAPAKRVFRFDGGGNDIKADNFMGVDKDDPLATKSYLPAVGDFVGVELTKGELIAHVYTDIEQTTEGATTTKVVETTVNKRASVDSVDIESDSTKKDFNFDDIMDLAPVADKSGTDDDESQVHGADAFTGTLTYTSKVVKVNDKAVEVTYTGQFQCKDTGTCTVERTGSAVTALTNFEFAPNDKQTMEVMEKADDDVDGDYLTFGVWLDNNDGSPEIGAYALGSDVFMPSTIEELTGTASYRGSAAGVYTDGSSVEHFDGTANLMADFGDTTVVDDPDTVADEGQAASFGYIEGTININGGGNTPAGTVNLGRADMNKDGQFTGNAWKGAAKPVDAGTGVSPGYAYGGMWGAQFYGNPAADAEDDDKLPGSVAGTFGVTGTDNMGTTTGDDATDDDVTRSWIGAFGATKQ